jgi:polysaccharide pyruvyl transferase WcaK-like protein
VRTFLNRHNAPLVPAPISNYRPGDADAIRELLRGIDDTSDGGITLDTPETLIPRIATCRVMLTGSYHSAVFALATGIPAVCLTRSSHYEHKMTGLLDMFDANPGERVIALDDPQLVAKLSAALAAAWEHAPAEQDALLEKARAQIALGTAAYARIFDRIAPPG